MLHTSLAIKATQIKATLRFHLSSVRITRINKTSDNRSFRQKRDASVLQRCDTYVRFNNFNMRKKSVTDSFFYCFFIYFTYESVSPPNSLPIPSPTSHLCLAFIRPPFRKGRPSMGVNKACHTTLRLDQAQTPHIKDR